MITLIDICCQQLELNASGPSLKTQKSAMGVYNQNVLISNDSYSVYTQQNGSHTIMFDVRHGWRVSN